MKLPAQKRTERRISVVSSAGTAKESVSIAKQRSRARGAAMYLIVFLEDKVVGDLGLNKSCGWFWTGQKCGWTCETSVGGGTSGPAAKERAGIRG